MIYTVAHQKNGIKNLICFDKVITIGGSIHDFFTSDLHLGHKSAIEFTGRPFTSIDDMNDCLIRNINDTVNESDELYILGDFAYSIGKEQVAELRNKISCRHIHLLKGNHDKDYSKDNIFESVSDYKVLKTEYGKVVLFHYPIQDWEGVRYGSIHLHGHIHFDGVYNRNNRNVLFADNVPFGHIPKHDFIIRRYDVGVDANNFKPISLEQIAEFFNISRLQ